MTAAPLLLVDLSSIAHPLWHLSGSEPDPNWTSTQIIAKVHALASGQPHVAICVDGPRSRAIRKAIDPTYKAQRDTAPEALFHQITCAIDALRADGFPIWEADGYEADDVIASAVVASADRYVVETGLAPSTDGPHMPRGGGNQPVLIVTADKDLCQLVGPRVTIKHALKGDLLDEAAVVAKFGVTPAQILDYLALVGDASDNIKGAKGIGAKTAAKLLAQFGTLDAIMATGGDGLTPAVRDSLAEFSSRCDIVRSLIALRTDVPVRIEEAFAPRCVATQEETTMAETQTDARDEAPTSEADAGTPAGERAPGSRVDRAVESSGDKTQAARAQAEARVEAQLRIAREASEAEKSHALVPQVMPAPSPAEWTMQLEPRSMSEAKYLADVLFTSKLFSSYGTPQAILSTVMYARELGIPSISGLRLIHNIEGKHALSADLMVGLVLKSKACEYFSPVEISDTKATFKTKRKGADEFAYTYTIEMAQRAGFIRKGSNWEKAPQDQLVARAKSKLARLIYPDYVGGLYTPDEMRDRDMDEAA